MITSKAGYLANVIRRDGISRVQAVHAEVKELTRQMYIRARIMSSIQHASLADLRKMGHPYARYGRLKLQKIPKGSKARSLEHQLARGLPPTPEGARKQYVLKGALPAPAYVINKQTARFYSAWHWNFTVWPNGCQGMVWNSAPYSKYMLGTSKMIDRPILHEAAQAAFIGKSQRRIARRYDVFLDAVRANVRRQLEIL